MKKIFLPLLALLLSATTIQAQLSQNITPRSFYSEVEPTENIPVVQMREVDVETLLAEDEINHATKTGPYRFGETMDVDIDFSNAGVWESLPNGDRIWRLTVSSPGAYSLNFVFNDFFLPEGSTIHFYNGNGENMLGAFTDSNNHPSREFGTYLLAGDRAVIEYFEPLEVRDQGTLGLNQVIHAYRDILSADASRGGGSGACNNNVACPEGLPWENEINAVTKVILGGGLCSGSMITDVPQSGTPYYLTANHCIQGAGSGNSWVFQFNYQSSTCSGTQGPTNQSLTGCVIRANNSGSDFALVELNQDPPGAYAPFYAGWDKTGNSPTNQVCIHHPSGDIKKISFDNNPATNATLQGTACWRIGNWEDGTTEGGSSGSPLFDQNHRIIGQLFAGAASCTNLADDYFGRFGVSWDGASASTRLKDWLDPQNTGVSTVDGYDPNVPTLALDASIEALSGISDGALFCQDELTFTPVITIKNRGINTLTDVVVNWTINSVAQTPYNWTGTLPTNGQSNISFPEQTLSEGSYTLEFSIGDINGSTDLNSNNDVISISFEIHPQPTFTTSSTGENLWTGGDNGTATITVSGGTPPYSYDWSPGNGNTPTITGLSAGNYTVTVTDAAGCEVGTSISIGDNVGINDLELAAAITVFPNPTSGAIRIEFPLEADMIDMTVTDVIGRTVKKVNVVGMQRTSIDFSGLTEGVYYLNFYARGKKATKKLVYLR